MDIIHMLVSIPLELDDALIYLEKLHASDLISFASLSFGKH